MVCPNCGRSFSQKAILKANIRGFEKVDIAYDALCPFCRHEIGRMFWGELILHESQRVSGQMAAALDNAGGWYCPHCGRSLPGDVDHLPTNRRAEERRRTERRGAERRQNTGLWLGVERRWHERRRTERRQTERRAEGTAEEQRATPVPMASSPEKRQSDRRRQRRPVLYERRLTGQDRRRHERGDVNRKV